MISTILRTAAGVALALASGFWLTGCSSYYAGAGHFDTVILDAGHGGHDKGARSVATQPEKVHALDITMRTAQILRQNGYRVILTRSSDPFISLPNRVRISNRTSDSVFVSIHLNWARRRSAAGLETYYYSPRSKRLAANIQREIIRTYRTPNRGVKYARYHVLRNNRRPAVLTELGFLSNRAEARQVESAAHRQKLAEGVARGIMAEKAGRVP